MKKVLNTIFILALCFSFITCGKDDPVSDAELTVSTTGMNFTKAADSKAFHIKTNVKWNVAGANDWCNVSPASGDQSGTIQIVVTVSENQTTAVRSNVLTVTAGKLSQTLMVTQEKNVVLKVSPSELTAKAEGEIITIDVEASETCEVVIDSKWITASAASGNKRSFTVDANPGVNSRQGTIAFSIGDLKQTVSVYQDGMDSSMPSDKTGMESDAAALAAKMIYGWNLGNTLEACNYDISASETMWGNPMVNQALIDGVKAAGFNAIRIPCAWSAYIEDKTTYKIKESWLARVKEVVDYVVGRDMYAIINIHWDGGWLEENPYSAKQKVINEKQKALWEQIAIYFRDYDEHLLFAGTNEVHKSDYSTATSENFTVQMSFNQTFVDAVRSTGGRNAWRNLVVQAYNTNIDEAVKGLKMPTDKVSNRLMAEVHYYDPYDYALQDDAKYSKYLWGKEWSGTYKSTWGQEDYVDAQFLKMKTNFVDKGIPVVLGEYGSLYRTAASLPSAVSHDTFVKSRNYYLQYLTQAAKKNGMIPFYWDNGPTGDKCFGLFDRKTGKQVYPETIQAMMKK